jgi:UDP-N-acetylglucosamine 2-epimerase (non-hydrolysing)
MPEEINRKVTDVLADLLFGTEESGVKNLRAEGVPAERIFLVGNVMIDTLLRRREVVAKQIFSRVLNSTPQVQSRRMRCSPCIVLRMSISRRFLIVY